MKVKSWLYVAFAAAAGITPEAYAQVYIGAGGGYTTASIPTATTANIVGAITASPTLTVVSDDNAWGIKGFAGYDINQYFAAELGYARFGTFGLTSTTAIPSTVPSSVKANAWYIDGIGKLPVGQGFSLYGRVGLTWYDVKNQIPAAAQLEDTGWSWKGGLGGQYDLNKNFGFRAEWERYQNMGSNVTTGKVDVNLFNAQALWKF